MTGDAERSERGSRSLAKLGARAISSQPSTTRHGARCSKISALRGLYVEHVAHEAILPSLMLDKGRRMN